MRRLLVALLAAAALCGVAATAADASTWCGTPTTSDLLPQAVPGPSVHLVYAYPSDGTDRLGQLGTTMENDAELIDTWWRGQDPARTPRFDTFAFSCGPQLDITDVKLQSTTAELLPLSGRFDRIEQALAVSGLVGSDFVDYLVYLDGPHSGDSVCGQGGTLDPTHGGGIAVVYVASCPDVPTSVTAAHEMTHELGAVIAPAPHDCPVPNDGHVCDSMFDLMYPFVDETPLSSLILDVGRDDYYGASGIGFDVRSSRWLRHLDEPQSHLALGLTGFGSVSSDMPGIVCASSCDSDWDAGLIVTLHATPADGMRFVRWGGACAGDSDCTLSLAGAVSATALFAPESYVLAVAVTGQGTVWASNGQRCTKRCKVSVTSYTSVRLRATAKAGWKLKRWGGACKGARLTCTVAMTKTASAAAVFVKKPKAK